MRPALKPGAKVLDIGSGSGILLASFNHLGDRSLLFYKMMGQGQVYGVEHIKQLADKSIENISRSHAELISSGRIVIIEADGRKGLPEHAPYDCIHVGACIRSSHIHSLRIDSRASRISTRSRRTPCIPTVFSRIDGADWVGQGANRVRREQGCGRGCDPHS